MSQHKDLGLQRSSRPEKSDQRAPDELANVSHRKQVSTDSRILVSRFGFAVRARMSRLELWEQGDETAPIHKPPRYHRGMSANGTGSNCKKETRHRLVV